jgi:predicted ATP-grasp superfamily ATP-dependent carboligase
MPAHAPFGAATGLPRRLLLVGLSARMLVRSAQRAGLRAVALDGYGDADTRAAADWAGALPAGPAGFDPAALLDAAARQAPGLPLVYGSGFDGAPDLLAELARGRTLLGNPPQRVRQMAAPDAFFTLLDRLGIPYPEMRRNPPADPENWLVKAGCGEGGKRVRFCADEKPAGASEYYQRRLPGPALSALFLADGRDARIIGFNTLETVSLADRPFLFGGALNRASLDAVQREEVAATIRRLVRATGLCGLNSLDFMPDSRVCRVLEVNPRPSATLALYDADFPEGLLAAHIRACQGHLDDLPRAGQPVRAFAVAFAPRDIAVPEGVAWPRWCADRPVAGTCIPAGQPFCTVEAEGTDPAAVRELLDQRRRDLFLSF